MGELERPAGDAGDHGMVILLVLWAFSGSISLPTRMTRSNRQSIALQHQIWPGAGRFGPAELDGGLAGLVGWQSHLYTAVHSCTELHRAAQSCRCCWPSSPIAQQ